MSDPRLSIRCAACGRSGVRIYRWYMSAYDETENRCNACLQTPADATDWMVPVVMGEDGMLHGYLGVPSPIIDWFYSLPEALNDAGARVWKRRGEEGKDYEGWGVRGRINESILDKHKAQAEAKP